MMREPAWPCTAEQLAACAHPGSVFPELTAVRMDLLHGDATARPALDVSVLGPVRYCAGYQVFWEVPRAVLRTGSALDSRREHFDMVLAFLTVAAAAEVFGRFFALYQALLAAPPDPDQTKEFRAPPTLGEERLAELTTTFSRRVVTGTDERDEHLAQYGFVYRRGPVLVLCGDQFSSEAADFALALRLAEDLDTRLAAALAEAG
jgi:hypothetical protein